MNWRESLEDYQQRRIEQIENYAQNFGYHDAESDQFLIATLINRLDNSEYVKAKLFENRPFWIKWIDKLVQKNEKKFGGNNYYTCRLFRRIDGLIFRLKGKRAYWSNSGHLCIGHCETVTFFPQKAYKWAADIQNRYYWTRIILNI